MKKTLIALIVSLAFFSYQAFAHHAAQGVVDDETYNMIEQLILDTPHADMTLDDLGAGMTEITIVVDNYPALQDLMDGGLLELVDSLHGNTTIMIKELDPGPGYIVTIITHGENYDYNDDNNSSWENAPHRNPR